MIQESGRLQVLFQNCDEDKVKPHAALDVTFDDVDEFAVVGEFCDGVNHGIQLYEELLEARKTDKNAYIYKLTYGYYADDDGIMFFIGSEDKLAELFTQHSKPEE